MTGAQITDKIVKSADDVDYSGTALDGLMTAGKLNAYKALTWYGDISELTDEISTTWQDSVWVSGDIHVPSGHTLTIASGTTVHVAQDDLENLGDYPNLVEWFIEGSINWQGSETDPIVFKAFADDPDSLWVSPAIIGGASGFASYVTYESNVFEDGLTQPIGGESAIAGQILPVSWTADHLEPSQFPGAAPAYYRAETVAIEVSWNGGTAYESVVSDYPVDAESFLWVTPDSVSSTDALLRLHYVDSYGIRVASVESDSTWSLTPLSFTGTGTDTGLYTTDVPYATLYLDMDEDEDQDLLLSKDQAGKPAVLFGAGSNVLSTTLPRYVAVPTAIPSGVAATRSGHVADYDGDGDLDIALAAESGARILKNTTSGGTLSFSDETTTLLSAINADDSWAVAFADYDRDGDMDLYVGRGDTGTGGDPGTGLQDVLLAQDDNGQFADVATASGIDLLLPIASTAVCWADIDNDGQLDLFVGHGGDDPEGSSSDRHSKIYMQYYSSSSESAKFTVSEPWDTAGHQRAHAEVRAASWADLDGDGNMDLIVASEVDFAAEIHWGDGTGGFDETTDIPEAKSLSIADLNLDGRYELGLTRLVPDSNAVPAIMKATDSMDARVFTDEVVDFGLDKASIGSSADYRSIVMVDVGGKGPKGDGDPDILLGRVTSAGDEFFMENPATNDPTSSPQWIRIKLDGLDNTANPPMGTGAFVRVTTYPDSLAEIVQTQIMGQGMGGVPSDELVFGLGYYGVGATVDATWSDSFGQSITLAAADLDSTKTIEDDHGPALLGSTAGAVAILLPNSTVDWVFSWQTDHSTDPALDEVRVKRDSDLRCPSMVEVVLTPTSGGVTHQVIPIADGKYYHRLTWHGQACGAKCSYEFKVKSGTSVSTQGTGWKTFSILICIN